MKKLLLIMFAACAGNILFALSFDEAEAMLKAGEYQTDLGIMNNAKVNIKAQFGIEASIEKSYPDSGIKMGKTSKSGSMYQVCSGALISGGIVMIPKACAAKKDTYETTSGTTAAGTLETTTNSKYSLKDIKLTLSDGSAVNVNAGEVRFGGNYAFVITGQNYKIKNLPKLAVFDGSANLQEFLKNTARNNLSLATGQAAFKADGDYAAKCVKNGCAGPAFFENTLIGVVNQSNIYAIKKGALPQSVLAALGDNIEIF